MDAVASLGMDCGVVTDRACLIVSCQSLVSLFLTGTCESCGQESSPTCDILSEEMHFFSAVLKLLGAVKRQFSASLASIVLDVAEVSCVSFIAHAVASKKVSGSDSSI